MVPCVTLDGETQMPPLSADSLDFRLMVSDLHFLLFRLFVIG